VPVLVFSGNSHSLKKIFLTRIVMEITVLGCGDAFGSGGRLQTSFLVQTAEHTILLDCGATILPALHKQDFSSEHIDAVVITHFHGDHYGGLPFLLLEAAKRYKRSRALTLVGPKGLQERLEKLLPLLYPGTEDVFRSFPIHYHTYGEEAVEVVGLAVQAWEVTHSEESLPHGVRISSGEKVLAFSGDTTWHENLIPLAQGADLFICECNLWKGKSTAHLSWEVLQKNLARLSAKKIVLTHAGQEVLERQHEIPLTILADGNRLHL
jgi:ribonuclease BN (tRNA processing enzyme)